MPAKGPLYSPLTSEKYLTAVQSELDDETFLKDHPD
jgi:hypothetical protein